MVFKTLIEETKMEMNLLITLAVISVIGIVTNIVYLVKSKDINSDEIESQARINRDKNSSDDKEVESKKNSNPEDLISQALNNLNLELSRDILINISKSSSDYFKELIVTLLINLGYGGSHKEAGEAFKVSRYGGVDGVINEDRLGLELIYVQARHWNEGSIIVT